MRIEKPAQGKVQIEEESGGDLLQYFDHALSTLARTVQFINLTRESKTTTRYCGSEPFKEVAKARDYVKHGAKIAQRRKSLEVCDAKQPVID